MPVIEIVQLIFSDVVANNNKVWKGSLYDDNRVVVEWGRVGATMQSKDHGPVGKGFLEKIKASKIKKGYSELKVLSNTSSSTVREVAKDNLHEIAKQQIQTSDPLVDKLVERLVKANVHKITSQTNITFNEVSGTFSTPLGVVTLDAINEARQLLTEIDLLVEKNSLTTKPELVSKYLRLIPQKIKGRLQIERIFPNKDAIKNQSDILDSLEASYNACLKTPLIQTSTIKVDAPNEKVFSVKLALAPKDKVEEIRKLYRNTNKSYHQSSSLDVLTVYEVTIASMAETFEKKGKPIGNIKQLWHGTKDSNLLSILKSGLKVSPPSSAGITGKMFGVGIYFSDQSTKALNYASGYWDGNKKNNCFMFLAQVAMGKSYMPKNSSEKLPKAGYDSTFAEASKSGVMNNEMIIYNEAQCNLVYLVEFGK